MIAAIFPVLDSTDITIITAVLTLTGGTLAKVFVASRAGLIGFFS